MVTMILPPMRFRSEQGQLEPATLFNAELVVDPELASSASLVDVEAEETAQCQRQVKTALLIFLVIDIFVSIPIQKKKASLKTLAPSETPSVSPSQSLFGFLAEHSFDNGTALSTTGSSQKRHLQGWRSKSTLYNSATDYVVLQFYVLAVFNYATGDLLSGESWLHDNGTASEYNFCDWDNTDCNDGRTDITALSPLGSQLFGSLTPEIACCLIIP